MTDEQNEPSCDDADAQTAPEADIFYNRPKDAQAVPESDNPNVTCQNMSPTTRQGNQTQTTFKDTNHENHREGGRHNLRPNTKLNYTDEYRY